MTPYNQPTNEVFPEREQEDTTSPSPLTATWRRHQRSGTSAYPVPPHLAPDWQPSSIRSARHPCPLKPYSVFKDRPRLRGLLRGIFEAKNAFVRGGHTLRCADQEAIFAQTVIECL